MITPGDARRAAELCPRGQALRGRRGALPAAARGNRKGSVESSCASSGRWWRTLRAKDPVSAQASLDRFLTTTGDARERRTDDGRRTTVGALADAEPLMAAARRRIPGDDHRGAHGGRQRHCGVPRQPLLSAARALGLVRRSPPPAVLHDRRGAQRLGVLLAGHERLADGLGAVQRLPEHRQALESAVLAAFTTKRPCDRKANRPPGPEALAEAARLLGAEGRDVVVDLARYAELVEVTA